MQSLWYYCNRAHGSMDTTGEEHWETRRHSGFAMIVIICYHCMQMARLKAVHTA